MAASDGFVGTAGGFAIAAGVVLGVIRFAGGTPVERGLEGALAAAALGAVVAAPGVLAVVALRHRPALLLAAGVALLPLAFLSFAGVTLPLLIPAAMLLVAYGRRGAGAPAQVVAATTVFVVAGLVAATVVLLFGDPDPRTFTTDHGGGSVSDVITVGEALLSLALTAAASAGGAVLAGAGDQ